jgi:hypothetical protein
MTEPDQGTTTMTEQEPVNITMTEPKAETQPEAVMKEGDEYFAGGIELYAVTVEENGRPGIDFICEPVGRDREIPESIKEFNHVLEEMCRSTVTNFPNPQTLGRFFREVRKDKMGNKCWYRVTVMARVGAGDAITARVTDEIDQALIRADPHVRFRARQLRAMLMRGMGVGDSS